MTANSALALVNAALTTGSAAFATLGYLAIRRRDVAAHRRCMLTALCASGLFMVGFILRYVRFGHSPFAGGVVARIAFNCVWYTHEPVAVLSVPLVLSAAVLALGGRFEAHREIAPVALAAWLFSAVTGVAVYALLYMAR